MSEENTCNSFSLDIAGQSSTRAVGLHGLRLHPVIIGLCVALIGSHHSAAMAVEPTPTDSPGSEPSEFRGRLRVRVDPLIEDAALIHDWIVDRHPDMAEDRLRPEGPEQWVAVDIKGVTYDYQVSVVGFRDGKPVGAKEPRRCECTAEDLLTLVDEEITTALDQLRMIPLEASRTPVHHSGPRVPLAVVTPSSTMSKRDDDKPLGWLGYTGIGVGSTGCGLMVAGIPFALQRDRVRGKTGDVEIHSTRGLGVGLAMVGGAALAVGAGLVVLELVQARRRAVTLSPVGGPGRAGLTVTWYF